MKAREYCCCAIPIVNAGIYAALLEQFALGITAGTLSVATQSSTSQRAKPNNIFLPPFIETYVSCSCRCCNAKRCQVGLRHNLLYRGRHPSVRLHRCLEGEQIGHHPWIPQHTTMFKRPLLRKDRSYSNDICRSTGSSSSLGSLYLSFGSSSPPLDTPRHKLTARRNITLPTRRVAVPLHLQMHQILSATSFHGLMSGSWEDYGLSS